MPFILLDPANAEAAPIVGFAAPLQDVGETLASIREAVFKETGSRTNLPNVLGGDLDKAINWAYRQMMASIKIKECFASFSLDMVVDQPLYLLPQACASIRTVSGVDDNLPNGGWKLTPIDVSQYYRLPDLDRRPENYFRYGRGGSQMLVVYGDPDDTQELIVDCRIRPDDMAQDDDSPILPEEFHEALIELSKHRAFRFVQDYPKAKQAKNDYKDAISDVLSTDADEDGELPSGIQFVKDPRDLARIRTRRINDDRG